MSEWFYRTVNWFAGCLAIASLFGLAVFIANIEIKDMDLWLHLAAGKHILETFSIPRSDIFSCTVANAPWINHEWLFQVLVYAARRAAGMEGLISLNVGLVVVSLAALLFLGYSRERQLGPAAVLLLVLLVYQLRMTLRPDMFSLLFFALTVSVLGLHLDKRWSVGAVFLMQVIWTNTHGFFILGPFLALIALFSEGLKRRVKLPFEWNDAGRLSDGEYRRLKLIVFAAAAACLANPYFVQGAWYPLKIFFSIGGESGVFFSEIQELQRTLHWETAFTPQPYLAYKLLFLVSFFSFLINYRKVDVNALMLWAVFLAFSLSALRNIVFFAFAAYFAFLSNVQYIHARELFPARWNDEKFRQMTSAVLKVIFIFWIAGYGEAQLLRGYFDFDRFERKSEYRGVSLRNFPYKAADFLVTNGIKGNFFNDFNSGAYLIGRAYPDVKVFIDGRTEVYGAGFFKKQQAIWEGDEQMFEEAVNEYQLTGAFLNSVYVPAPEKFIRSLYAHPQWALVYFDYDAAIFLRDVPENQPWISRFRVDLAQWQVPDAELLKIGTHKVIPYRHVNRAYALYNMGFAQKAMEEAGQALRIQPSHAKANKLIGKIHNERGEYAAAFESLRKAKLTDPQDMKVRFQIAFALVHLGQIEQAKEQLTRVLAQKPNDPEALFLIALIYAQEFQYDRMMAALTQAHRQAPQMAGTLIRIGELLKERREHQKAQEVFRIAAQAGARDQEPSENVPAGF